MIYTCYSIVIIKLSLWLAESYLAFRLAKFHKEEKMKSFLKKLFCKLSFNSESSNDPVLSTLKEIEDYQRKSWKEVIEKLNQPRKKSDFVIEQNKRLGPHLPEYY
jgi:hypothetical protein